MIRALRALHRRLRPSGRGGVATGDEGFTLVEVLTSFTLFVVVAATATYGILGSQRASHASQQRVDAANVAQALVADARAKATTIGVENGHVISTGVGNGATYAREQFTAKRWIIFSWPNATQCSPGTTFAVNVLVYQGSATDASHLLARSDSVVACPPA
jgi:type II secretory pathway pseudopilin PulG